MNFSKYRYNPEDFESIQFMTDDLMAFYEALEKYHLNNRKDDYEVLDKLDGLQLILKHRTLDGSLLPAVAGEIESYLVEVAYD